MVAQRKDSSVNSARTAENLHLTCACASFDSDLFLPAESGGRRGRQLELRRRGVLPEEPLLSEEQNWSAASEDKIR